MSIETTELELDGETLGVGLAIDGVDREVLERAREVYGVEPDQIALESLKGGIERLEESLDALTEEGAHP